MKTIVSIMFLLISQAGLMDFAGNDAKPKKYGEIGNFFIIIDGFKVHNDLVYLLSESQWSCWAKRPASNYQIHRCQLCQCYYLSQQFVAENGSIYNIFKYADNCDSSPTGFCDGLPLNEMGPCKCDTKYLKLE